MRKLRYSTRSFVAKAKTVHIKENYNYQNVFYRGVNVKVKIGCPKHGPFWTNPSDFLRGRKCPECKKEERELSVLKNWKAKSTVVHDGRYDYSRVKYVSSRVKVKIVCPEHGPFLQLPSHHAAGHGCSKCCCGTSSISKLGSASLNRIAFFDDVLLFIGMAINFSKNENTKLNLSRFKNSLFKNKTNKEVSRTMSKFSRILKYEKCCLDKDRIPVTTEQARRRIAIALKEDIGKFLDDNPSMEQYIDSALELFVSPTLINNAEMRKVWDDKFNLTPCYDYVGNIRELGVKFRASKKQRIVHHPLIKSNILAVSKTKQKKKDGFWGRINRFFSGKLSISIAIYKKSG